MGLGLANPSPIPNPKQVAQGGELFTLLRSHKRFEEPHACLYAAMVASAFAYLHARRVMHREL